MSYYRPKGKELRALKRIRSKVSAIEDAQSSLHLFATNIMIDPGGFDSINWQIDTDHALDGVKVNGTGQTTTLATIILAVDRIRAERKRLGTGIEREIKKLDTLLMQIEQIIAPFGLCPSCMGSCGRKVKTHGGVLSWEDCCFCEGRGVLL